MNKLYIVILTIFDKEEKEIARCGVRRNEYGVSPYPIPESGAELFPISSAEPATAIQGEVVHTLTQGKDADPVLAIWVNSQFPDFAVIDADTVVVETLPLRSGDGESSVTTLRVTADGTGVTLSERMKPKLKLPENDVLFGYDLTVPPPDKPGDKYEDTVISDITNTVVHRFTASNGQSVHIKCTRGGSPIQVIRL